MTIKAVKQTAIIIRDKTTFSVYCSNCRHKGFLFVGKPCPSCGSIMKNPKCKSEKKKAVEVIDGKYMKMDLREFETYHNTKRV
jgi:RecJ-like exonuclease